MIIIMFKLNTITYIIGCIYISFYFNVIQCAEEEKIKEIRGNQRKKRDSLNVKQGKLFSQ